MWLFMCGGGGGAKMLPDNVLPRLIKLYVLSRLRVRRVTSLLMICDRNPNCRESSFHVVGCFFFLTLIAQVGDMCFVACVLLRGKLVTRVAGLFPGFEYWVGGVEALLSRG